MYTNTNAIEIVFCKQSNWDDQITKAIVASNQNNHQWRPFTMCPKDTYISGAKARFNAGYNVDYGLTGLSVKC